APGVDFKVKQEQGKDTQLRIFPNSVINIICNNVERFCIKSNDYNGFSYGSFKMVAPNLFLKPEDRRLAMKP
ncbi:MAG: hypothetical protein NTY61_01340, partial [Candidatus Parcubacteria bacterium]|nr:hypothetical protein [Candidatus Parcubacteria bacterium]